MSIAPAETNKAGRNPDWAPDERMVALDFYLRTRGQMSYSRSRPEVIALSDAIRSLGLWPTEVRGIPTFRNVDGTALKLANFCAIDPQHEGAGMPNGSRGDQETWDVWHDRPDELAQVVRRILAVGTSEDLSDEDDGDFEAEEGAVLLRKHRRIERDRTLVRKKRAKVIAEKGTLACEVCEFDSREAAGVEWVIDVHHVVPLHLVGQGRTRLSDLALVCPTCHRLLHAYTPVISPADLKSLRISLH